MAEPHMESQHMHIGIPGYLIVFGILVFGTILTFVVALQDLDWIFPGANTLVALAIAFTKMSCVMLFFMHVRWSPKLIWLAAICSFFWLSIMFAFTMQDYLTRGLGVFST
ncbi:MAG TPA: cytochrome C oxidase subunit IV family protein [Pyrinomonadaceae bacterium]|jgi:cytochrome c oxidase subunit 4